MKESLKLLKVEASGLDTLFTLGRQSKTTEEEILNKVEKMKDLNEQELYLQKILKNDPSGFENTKRYLANLVKTKNPELACKLIFSVTKSTYLDPRNYLCYAEIAIANNAYLIAKDVLETACWLSAENDRDIQEGKIENLLSLVLSKIENKDQDNSLNEFWRNKFFDKFIILQKLYNSNRFEDLYNYALKLLNRFPESITNYYVVYKALILIKDIKAISNYIDFINSHLKENLQYQKLYLGMAYHLASNFDKSNGYLNEVLAISPNNIHALYHIALNHLLENKPDDFIDICAEFDLSFHSYSLLALSIISCALADNKLLYDLEFPDQKNISSEIRRIVEMLIQAGRKKLAYSLIEQFKKLDYLQTLPFLQPNLVELFIELKELDYAKELLKDCKDIEYHRLSAWMHRLEGNETLAEKELAKYREQWVPDKYDEVSVTFIDLDIPEPFSNNTKEIFSILETAYLKTKDLIKDISTEYGINQNTCIELKCSDCCKKTFPPVTYIEYLYMREWLDKQPEKYKNEILEKSKKIVLEYKKKFKKEPMFVYNGYQSLKQEYPSESAFTCPFLNDNKCSAYDAWPFSCRTYGFSTGQEAKYISCEYFFRQIKGASRLSTTRKAINIGSFYSFANQADLKLIGKTPMAPIPIWFAQSHEEVLKNLSL